MKALSLQIQSQLSQPTLLAIFQQYYPSKLGIKEFVIYVQIDDQNRYCEFIKNVKNGAFPELTTEIFQILDSPANMQSCFQKCLTVFTSISEIQTYFLDKNQKLTSVMEPTNSFIDKQLKEQQRCMDETNFQYENTILFNAIYEPSEVVKVDFDGQEYPPIEEIIIQAEGKPEQQQGKINEYIQQYSSQFQKIQEERKEETTSLNVNQSQTQPQLQTQTLQKEINTVDAKKVKTSDNYILLFLWLWIVWLII